MWNCPAFSIKRLNFCKVDKFIILYPNFMIRTYKSFVIIYDLILSFSLIEKRPSLSVLNTNSEANFCPKKFKKLSRYGSCQALKIKNWAEICGQNYIISFSFLHTQNLWKSFYNLQFLHYDAIWRVFPQILCFCYALN